jgi:hypothetical protein
MPHPAPTPRLRPPRRLPPGLLLLLAWLALSSPLVGGVARAEGAAPLALTISGGGTKGAYMAGHLYYMGQVSHFGGEPLQPRVATGASAGAINAVLVAFTACIGVKDDPTQSLYWHAWTPTGLKETFVPAETTATGVFTASAFSPMIAELREIWDGGLPTECDLLLGFAITRAQARMVVLAPDFPPLPRSRETVLVRIIGQGPGRPPLVRNVLDPDRAAPDLALPLDGPDAKPFDSLIEVVLASAAFPVGFSPVSVAHCLAPPGAAGRCTPAMAQRALFMDGGIFDNQPLGVAVRAMRYIGRSAAGDITVNDAPAPVGTLPEGARFYFLDPRARTTPTVGQRHDDPPPDSAIGVVGQLLGMVESGASSALVSVLDQSVAVRDRLLVARTHYPQISGTFNGLLERAFREFDFYLGMYNAARTVREHALAEGMPDVLSLRAADPDPAVREAWRPALCLAAVLDGDADTTPCDGDDLLDLRILLQVVLDQLADECRAVAAAGGTPPPTNNSQCAAAMAGGPPEQVPGVPVIEAAAHRRLPGEGPLDYQLRLLGRYGFWFRDLGLARADAEEAPQRLIRVVHRVAQRFADEQPRFSLAYGVIGRIGVDVALGYIPPQHSLHATLGLGAELGYSVSGADPDWGWLRFTAALAFDGLSTIFNAVDDYFAIIPKAGVELEVYGSAAFQLRMGVRAGYQLSTSDDFTTGRCRYDNEKHQPCSRFMSEAYAAASLFGLLRLQVAVVYEPGLADGQRDLVAVRPTLGFQLNSPF